MPSSERVTFDSFNTLPAARWVAACPTRSHAIWTGNTLVALQKKEAVKPSSAVVLVGLLSIDNDPEEKQKNMLQFYKNWPN